MKASLPGVAANPKTPPQVFVSTTPAELIRVNGAPTYVPVTGTRLLWVSNTESDVFRLGANGAVYYLVAGRWFTAPWFSGPWTFATPTLPADFMKISLEHPRSRVLASVPGTPQAAEAVLLAQVPQTARVNPKELKGPEVVYQGEPQFEAIEKTSVARAVNTDKDIIKVGDLYHMCFQGVWFMGRTPNGPWQAAETVPSQIYEIPASSPSHNVTYVTVVEDDDDDWVTFAAVAGYTGMMIGWGCAVWGSGWYLPAVRRVWRPLSGVLPVLSDLRLRRLVQPVDRRIRPRRRVVRTVRRRWCRREIQPVDGCLLARCRGVGTGWRARRGGSVQPTHGRVRTNAAGFGRVRQLGGDIRAARQSMGADLSRDESSDRNDDASDTGQRWRDGRHPEWTAGKLGSRADRQRRRVRGPRRQRLPTPGGGWQKYDNGSWGIGRYVGRPRSRGGQRPQHDPRNDRRYRHENAVRLGYRRTTGPRSCGTYRRGNANPRLRHGTTQWCGRDWELSAKRRRARRRRPAAVTARRRGGNRTTRGDSREMWTLRTYYVAAAIIVAGASEL